MRALSGDIPFGGTESFERSEKDVVEPKGMCGALLYSSVFSFCLFLGERWLSPLNSRITA